MKRFSGNAVAMLWHGPSIARTGVFGNLTIVSEQFQKDFDVELVSEGPGTYSARSRMARATAIRLAGDFGCNGRVMVQIRRCFIANDMQPVTSADLRRWAFAGRPREQWMHWSLTRALRSLGAVKIGITSTGNHPAIWSLDLSSPNHMKSAQTCGSN